MPMNPKLPAGAPGLVLQKAMVTSSYDLATVMKVSKDQRVTDVTLNDALYALTQSLLGHEFHIGVNEDDIAAEEARALAAEAGIVTSVAAEAATARAAELANANSIAALNAKFGFAGAAGGTGTLTLTDSGQVVTMAITEHGGVKMLTIS